MNYSVFVDFTTKGVDSLLRIQIGDDCCLLQEIPHW